MKKETFLIIDTETCGEVEVPLIYDFGYAICTRKGHIKLERRYLVSELFYGRMDLMQSCYFKNKLSNYWKLVQYGNLEVKSIFEIRKTMLTDMEQYGVDTIGAYNLNFDKRALDNTIVYATSGMYKRFIPKSFNIKNLCIWNLACQTLMNRPTYFKFATNNKLFSENGNIKTGAEMCYQYITNNSNFQEEHTSLEDVKIEIQIMTVAFKTHKKNKRGINTRCWQIPNKAYREYQLI